MIDGVRLTGYRERRERIAESAAALFRERGYDRVSTTEVAAAAGVSEKTVFNHFPRKEDLVFRRFDEVLVGFGEAIRSRDRERPLTDALIDDIRSRLEEEVSASEIVAIARIVDSSPGLSRRGLELFDDHARLLERLLAEELPGEDRGGLLRALSLALVGVHWAVMSERGAALARGVSLAEADRDALQAAERAYAVFDLGALHPSL